MGALGVTMGGTSQQAGMLRGQLTILGFAALGASAALTRTFSDMERTATIASIAAGEGASGMTTMKDEAVALGRELREKPSDMLELGRAISFFGLQSEAAEDKVAEFSTRLAQITGDQAEDVATNLIRLLNVTRRTGETVDDAAERFDVLAASIFKTGINVTAGVGDLLSFLEIFQLVGVVSEATEREIVALAGAVADLTPRMREITTTATQRIFLTEEFEKLQEIFNNTNVIAERFPELMGLSAEAIADFRRARPIDFFTAVALSLEEAQTQDKFLSEMKELGVGQLRSARGLSALIANLDRLDELMNLTSDSTQTMNEFMKASGEVQATLSQRLTGLAGSLQAFAFEGGQVLEGFVGPLVGGLTDLFELINRNEDAVKALTALFTVVPLTLVGGLVARFAGQLLPLGTIGKALRGGPAAFDKGVPGIPQQNLGEEQLFRLMASGDEGRAIAQRVQAGAQARVLGGEIATQAQFRAISLLDEELFEEFAKRGSFKEIAENLDDFANISDEAAEAVREAARAERGLVSARQATFQASREGAQFLDDLQFQRARRFQQAAIRSPLFGAVPGEIASERLVQAGIIQPGQGLGQGGRGILRGTGAAISNRLARSTLFQTLIAGPGRVLGSALGLRRGDATREFLRTQGGRIGGLARGAAGRAGGFLRPGTAAARRFQQLGFRGAAGRAFRGARFGLPVEQQFITQGTRLGAAAEQAGLRGLLPRAGLQVGRLGGGIARRFGGGMLGRIGGRVATGLIPGLNIASILGLFAPVLDFLGDAFDGLADRGGALGLVFNSLSIVFRTLELVGRSFNFVFDLVIDGFLKFIDLLGKIPGVSQAFDLLNRGLGAISGALENANENLKDTEKNVEGMASQVAGASRGGFPGGGGGGGGRRGGGGDTIINVEGGSNVDENMRKARDVVIDAVWAQSRRA